MKLERVPKAGAPYLALAALGALALAPLRGPKPKPRRVVLRAMPHAVTATGPGAF